MSAPTRARPRPHLPARDVRADAGATAPGAAPPAAGITALRPSTARPGRDRLVDLLRAWGTICVIVMHWVIPEVAWNGHQLEIGNALVHGWGWLATWAFQVIPLMFFASGCATHLQLSRRPRPTLSFVRARIRRLLPPVAVFAAFWIAAAVVLPLIGVPTSAAHSAATLAPQLLWYLGVYLILLLLSPLLFRAFARFGHRLTLAVAAGAALVDLARFTLDLPVLGLINIVLVWAVPYLLGYAYAAGPLTTIPRGTLLVGALGSLALLALLVAVGPYPASMVGMPGAPLSNMNPPTVCLLALTGLHLSLALLWRRRLERLAARPTVAALVGWIGRHSMTLYLWHLTAMFFVIGAALFALDLHLPDSWSTQWWLTRALWFGAAGLVLAVLVLAFRRAELRRPPRPGTRPSPVPLSPVLPAPVDLIGPELPSAGGGAGLRARTNAAPAVQPVHSARWDQRR